MLSNLEEETLPLHSKVEEPKEELDATEPVVKIKMTEKEKHIVPENGGKVNNI